MVIHCTTRLIPLTVTPEIAVTRLEHDTYDDTLQFKLRTARDSAVGGRMLVPKAFTTPYNYTDIEENMQKKGVDEIVVTFFLIN